MSKSELLEHLDNCEVYARKLRLDVCNSSTRTDTAAVRCLDILKSLRNNDVCEESSDKKLSSISPPFPARRQRRNVLQNRTNDQGVKYESESSKKSVEKESALKDANNPGTVSEMILKVPTVEKHYTVKKRIGWGTFSSVFLGSEKNSDVEATRKNFALKHVYSSSTSTKRVLFETKCLREIGGCDNVVGLHRIIGNGSEHVLVMPFYKHDRFSVLIRELSFDEVREYMRSLLIALRRVHKFNVIHRDVKPSNFLYNTKSKICALVDFGLAHNAYFYKPTQKKSSPPILPIPCLRRKSVTVAEVAEARRMKRDKKAGNSNSFHTRSSSMVAMAKNIHRLNVGSLKRSAGHGDEEEEVDILNVKAPTGSKKLCMTPLPAPPPQPRPIGQWKGTPRPTFRQRPGFDHRGIPIYFPNPSTPSPLSTSSERTLTSPLGGGSTGGHTSGKTIGDMLPCIRANAKTRDAWMTKPHQCSAASSKQKCKCCSSSKLVAPRAGTPGFRSPEVLIQCPHQTTAVDVWSVGIVFLSILSGRYPFFKPTDDMESIVQMIAIFGTERLKKLTRYCGKKLTAPYFCSGHKLQTVIEFFRKMGEEQNKKEDFAKPSTSSYKTKPSAGSNGPSTFTKAKIQRTSTSQIYVPPYKVEDISSSAYDLLERLLDVDPFTRISAKEALDHPFFLNEFL